MQKGYKINFKDISSPMELRNIKKFENQNTNVSIYVFGPFFNDDGKGLSHQCNQSI